MMQEQYELSPPILNVIYTNEEKNNRINEKITPLC